MAYCMEEIKKTKTKTNNKQTNKQNEGPCPE